MCTTVRVEVPEQLPSPENTTHWKSCEYESSNIGGYVPCIKYYSDLDQSIMIRKIIKIGLDLIPYQGQDTECTYTSTNCQYNTTNLNETISYLGRLKINEIGNSHTCYQSDSNIYFEREFTKKTMDLLIVCSVYIFFLVCCRIFYNLYHIKYKCRFGCRFPFRRGNQSDIVREEGTVNETDNNEQISLQEPPPPHYIIKHISLQELIPPRYTIEHIPSQESMLPCYNVVVKDPPKYFNLETEI